MTRPVLRYFGLALVLLAVPAAGTPQIDPEQRLDLSLRDADLIEVLESFAAILGGELAIDPDIKGSVTVELKGVPWREAIHNLCRINALRCELIRDPTPVLRVATTEGAEGAAAQPGFAEAIDLSLKGADLRQSLKSFGLITGRRLILDDGVAGSLTLDVQGVPWPVVLEEVCYLSGCRIEWGPTLRILPDDSGGDPARLGDLVVDGVSLADALERVADQPIFGAFGRPRIELATDLDSEVSLRLTEASWRQMLEALCEQASCRFALRYGHPSRLVVERRETRYELTVELPTAAVSLEEAAGRLARALDLDLDLEPGIDPRAEVRFERSAASWGDAIRELCAQAGCHWIVRDERLGLYPRVRILSERPRSDVGDRLLGVRFYPPGHSDPLEGTAIFDWTAPIQTADPGGADRWLARLSWIPFGPDVHWVIPSILHCGQDGPRVELLEPVRLPLAAPWAGQSRGALLELHGVDADGRRPLERGAAECDHGSPKTIRATLRQLPSTAVADARRAAPPNSSALDLGSQVGNYLLITLPSAKRPALPAAAVVTLGADDRGAELVAVVRPRNGGLEVDVERRALGLGEVAVERLDLPDGRRFELELSRAEAEP